MDQRFKDELDESLENLNQSIRVKSVPHSQLRHRILSESQFPTSKNSLNKRIWISVAAAVIIFLGSSPFYSTTMASLVAKIVPLEIRAKDTTNNDEIMAVIKETGYEINSIGMTVNPYTIEVSLIENKDSLATMKEVLIPKIETLLYEKGIDDYKLEITQFTGNEELPEKYSESSELMDKVGPIIREAFIHYGYTELGQSSTYGILKGKIVEVDMPDHIKEAEEILTYIKETIKEEELEIKQVKLNYYNEKHRNQDYQASSIVSEIYESLAGKSIYKVNGISYKVEKGVTKIWIKSKLPKNPDAQIISDIEIALREFMTSKETQDAIQGNPYKIELLSKSQKVLLQVSDDTQ